MKREKRLKDRCQMCGAKPGIPHHDPCVTNDPNYGQSLVTLHWTKAEAKTVCNNCRDGLRELRRDREKALVKLVRTQTAFWDAVREVESEFGVEIDDTAVDFDGFTVESFLAEYKDGAESGEEDGETDDEEQDEDLCTCLNRSWYGSHHDSACELTGVRQ